MSEQERFSIRLADGTPALLTAAEIIALEQDWKADLATLTWEDFDLMPDRLKTCLLHENNERCACCAPDLPATGGYVDGKPFDMPRAAGCTLELPEAWKLPKEMRGKP